MVSSFLRRARIVLKFLFPGPQARAEARVVRESGLFDRDFYLATNPRLRRFFRHAPELHYVLFGETMGLCPNAAFSPRAYLFNNPDIVDHRALMHFISQGHSTGRVIIDTTKVTDLALPVIDLAGRPTPQARVAVVLHLFYHDLWDDFATALGSQAFAFDLYVTATGTESDVAPLRSKVLQAFPNARLWAMPNHGRDIFPFLHLMHSGLLDSYEAVCKLHGKRSPHLAEGDRWRSVLLDGVMGPAALTQARLDTFLNSAAYGLWVANGQILEGDEWWGVNRSRAETLLAKANYTALTQPLRFPAGSVYWIKPSVLDALRHLRLSSSDFEREQQLVDGTTAHAIERLMGHLTTLSGLQMCTSKSLDG